MEERLNALERAQLTAPMSENPPGIAGHPHTSTSITADPAPALLEDVSTGSAVPAEESGHGPALNLGSNLGAFPASSVDAQAPDIDMASKADLVSRHVITAETANDCLDYFLKHLNPFLHTTLAPDITLAEIRARSPFLTAAVCTVACFCTASPEYQACNDAFISEVSGKLFSPKYDYDDVRALCIAAFWLDHVAPTLSGLGKPMARQKFLLSCSHLYSCTDRLSTGPPPMHHKDATCHTGLLRSNPAILPSLSVRPSLHSQVWPATDDTGVAFPEKPYCVHAHKVLELPRSGTDQPG